MQKKKIKNMKKTLQIVAMLLLVLITSCSLDNELRNNNEVVTEKFNFIETYKEYLDYIDNNKPYEGEDAQDKINIAKDFIANKEGFNYKVECKAYHHHQSGENHAVYVSCSDGSKWLVLIKSGDVALVYQQGT